MGCLYSLSQAVLKSITEHNLYTNKTGIGFRAQILCDSGLRGHNNGHREGLRSSYYIPTVVPKRKLLSIIPHSEEEVSTFIFILLCTPPQGSE